MKTHKAVALARGWIGTPYVHQHAVKGAGCDCLGLLRGVWRELGGRAPDAIPPYTMDWSEARGEELLWRAARTYLRPAKGAPAAGNILLFRMAPGAVAKHLGIQSRTGEQARFIHAYSGHGVVESPLSAPWCKRIVARFVFPELDAETI